MLQQQTQSPGWRVLNRDVIKYIAITAMLLNHIANIFLVPGTLWYEVLVDIGYFTAITMCYFLVEGFRYTHSRKQYALRLFGFGVVSQVPFSMAFAQNGILEFQDLNMMFTLFLCFCILLCIETIRNRFLRGVLIVLLVAIGNITPPVGGGIFMVKGCVPWDKEATVSRMFGGVWYFVVALFISVILIVAFPQLVTFLVDLM